MFRSKSVKFLMSIVNWQVSSSPIFTSFFIVMTYNSCVNFSLINFLLWIKGSHQSPKFETFKCSGKNLPNSSFHFSKHKSVFLQILHHSSVSWKITALHFLISNIIYFAQKDPIKKLIFETFKCLDQNSSNYSCQFWNDKSILFKNFASVFIVMTHGSSVNFKFIHFLLWTKRSY